MIVNLVGVQSVNFTDRDSGEQIKGFKLHVVDSEVSTDGNFKGQHVASIWWSGSISGCKIGNDIELVYEQPLGSTKARLVNVIPA